MGNSRSDSTLLPSRMLLIVLYRNLIQRMSTKANSPLLLAQVVSSMKTTSTFEVGNVRNSTLVRQSTHRQRTLISCKYVATQNVWDICLIVGALLFADTYADTWTTTRTHPSEIRCLQLSCACLVFASRCFF